MIPEPEALDWVRRGAKRLGDDMLPDIVFLGGATAGLLITAPRASSIRPTDAACPFYSALSLRSFRVSSRTV
ncbi:MAG: hypothetical protein KAI47_14740 [Deltaproteobacteria bacterium]|nr:hypothetical protein [Deltaproteobacteria bacterium]